MDKSLAEQKQKDLQYYEYFERWHDMKDIEQEMFVNQDGENENE